MVSVREDVVRTRKDYIPDVFVDVLDVHSETRESGSGDIIEDEVNRRRIVSGLKECLDPGAEEQVDCGVRDVELHRGWADRSDKGHALFDSDNCRRTGGGCRRNPDGETSGVGVYSGGTESESHVG